MTEEQLLKAYQEALRHGNRTAATKLAAEVTRRAAIREYAQYVENAKKCEWVGCTINHKRHEANGDYLDFSTW